MPIDFSSLKDNTGKVAADGAIHTLGAAQVIAISDAVQAHVSDCFARQAQVEANIASGAITTIHEVDEAFAT